jgi:hypothetical protein
MALPEKGTMPERQQKVWKNLNLPGEGKSKNRDTAQGELHMNVLKSYSGIKSFTPKAGAQKKIDAIAKA